MTYTKPDVMVLGNARALIEFNSDNQKIGSVPKDSEVDLAAPPAYDLDE